MPEISETERTVATPVRTFVPHEILRRHAVSPSTDKDVVPDDVSTYREALDRSCIGDGGTYDITSDHGRPAE